MIAESGIAALHILGESDTAIPIILTDLHMPEIPSGDDHPAEVHAPEIHADSHLAPEIHIPEIHAADIPGLDMPKHEHEDMATHAHRDAGLDALSDMMPDFAAHPADHEYSNTAEMATKLDLAVAYQEIGDKEGARELLDEVIKGGSPEHSEKAKTLLAKLG